MKGFNVFKTIKANRTYENPVTGMRTFKFDKQGTDIILGYMKDQGIDPASVIRGMNIDKRGRLSFRCGGGYAVFDADLFGGSGTGRAEDKFEEVTGCRIRY